MILPTANEGLFGSNPKEQKNKKRIKMQIFNYEEMQKIKEELQQIKQFTVLQAKRALTLKDVALLTSLSKSHLYKLTCSNLIPFYKNDGGKLLFFDKNEIEDWCLKHRHATVEETEQQAVNYCVTGKYSKKGG